MLDRLHRHFQRALMAGVGLGLGILLARLAGL
jgi:hypothetical protein